jgi:cellulose synthase/poly-beta-1,6-N-acetylglucosamine synthase-like glycosyltransferase
MAGEIMISGAPEVSIIVPVYNGHAVLPRTLDALLQSDLPRNRWELIVVDDASSDDTAEIAARYADVIVRLPGKPHGPAYARNRGCEAARGEILVFIDADVCIHPPSLRQFVTLFEAHPDVGAIFGSYDDRPAASGIISQYRNLLHHFVHHSHPGDAETFWAGCGAVRRRLFEEYGMFDEWHYYRPQVEDIELGHRIRAHGHRILLRPEILCTHLKRWTLRNVITTDLHDRGVPWMRLLVQKGDRSSTEVLNVRMIEKINTVLVWIGLVGLVAAAITRSWVWALGGVAIFLWVVLSNLAMFRFFWRRGWRLALAALPLHLLYYFLNGISAGTGILLHHLIGEPQPPPTVQAYAEVGVETWPPVPTRVKSSPWSQPAAGRDSADGGTA